MTLGRRALLATLFASPAQLQAESRLRDLTRRAVIYLTPPYEMGKHRHRDVVECGLQACTILETPDQRNERRILEMSELMRFRTIGAGCRLAGAASRRALRSVRRGPGDADRLHPARIPPPIIRYACAASPAARPPFRCPRLQRGRARGDRCVPTEVEKP